MNEEFYGISRDNNYDPNVISESLINFFKEKKREKKYPHFSEWYREIAKIDRTTFQLWRKKYAEFGEACLIAQDIQKEVLIDCGLSGEFVSRITEFTALNDTDMKNKSEGNPPNTQNILVLTDSELLSEIKKIFIRNPDMLQAITDKSLDIPVE